MKLHELNRGKGDNKFCGPAAISFISGVSTTDAAALIREVNPYIERVKGVWPKDVLKVLGKLGFRATRRNVIGKPTMKQWLRLSKEFRTAGRVFLVEAGHHYQIISGRKYACGRIGEIVGLSDKRIKNRSRVAEVWEIEANHDHKAKTTQAIKHVESHRSEQRADANQVQSARRRARKIAKEYDIDIEVDKYPGGSMSIYFIVPDWLSNLREEGEVYYESVAYDWYEAARAASDLEVCIRDCQMKGLDIEEVAA